jgi:flagellar motor switch/type III secretory pathway protein FliN
MMTLQAQQIEKQGSPELPAVLRQDSLERFEWLPCRLTLEVPVGEFTLGDLLRLQVGSVVATAIRSTSEIPLSVNGQLIARVQFEMIGERLAARIMELA